jgi:hypothetical protein
MLARSAHVCTDGITPSTVDAVISFMRNDAHLQIQFSQCACARLKLLATAE